MNNAKPEKEHAFLGTGWAFPIRLDENGEVQTVDHEEDIRQAILLILNTALTERVMRPDFGSGLRELVFEPMDSKTMALARHRVEQALITWEPRIDTIEVTVNAKHQQGELDIEIRYRVRRTNTFYNLVYPFYLQEEK